MISLTLDSEYRRRGLIRPSQFKKIHAKRRTEYETVSFDWKGTKVHGFRPRIDAQPVELEPAEPHHATTLTIGQRLADDR